MKNRDLDRVIFYSKEDMAAGYHLQKAESILGSPTKATYTDINDILELYNIKEYIDNELFLTSWSKDDIASFKSKASEYGEIIGKYMARIDDNNILDQYNKLSLSYTTTFWNLVNNHGVFKRISRGNFETLLSEKTHLISIILSCKKVVECYHIELRNFLLSYSKATEILLDIYETRNDLRNKQLYLPKTLTVADKELIIQRYLGSEDVNVNYLELIINAKNQKNEFIISNKSKLKAKKLYHSEIEKMFASHKGKSFGASISYVKNATKVVDAHVDENHVMNYTYSHDFIQENSDPYSLFQNFKYLFLFTDNQNRIDLISKPSQMNSLEKIIGLRSRNEYVHGVAFSLSESTSHTQMVSYCEIVKRLANPIESILHYVYTSAFPEKYAFADNARFLIPTATTYLEKVRMLAPEFESVLKQYKLFVEDGNIDFDLLQMSSSAWAIKDIPSLNQNKYLYINTKNEAMIGVMNLFFSNQTLLHYITPHQNKGYSTFFDILANEEVQYSNYEEHHIPNLNYLIEHEYISIDNKGVIQMPNQLRVLILKDLYENEVGSIHHYPYDFQEEAKQMEAEGIIYFENTLFSKPEQSYFNYYLNKSEFTNGMDLRNSYLHGTQATPEEIEKHENSYFIYLKLIVLAFLKIEGDLNIYKILQAA